MENVFEILKDLPKPGDYVLLTVAKGSAAGEKAILAEKKIIWESKENGFFSAHFSEAGDLKKCGLYEIREQQVFCDIIGGQEQRGAYKIDARYNSLNLINKIRNIAEKREQIVLLNQDAKELLQPQQLRRYYKTFINLDPPYVKKGAQLYKNAFTDVDHREVSQFISNWNRKWIVTYDICPLVAEIYRDFRSSYLDVTYSVRMSKKAQENIFFSNNLELPDTIELR